MNRLGEVIGIEGLNDGKMRVRGCGGVKCGVSAGCGVKCEFKVRANPAFYTGAGPSVKCGGRCKMRGVSAR